MTNIKEKSPEVIASRDYNKFKRIKGNRVVSIPHVNNIVKQLSLNNLLYAFPVVVTKDDYVIDGQHRIDAAKKADLPYFYIKLQDNIDDIVVALVNSARREWSLNDYINFYAERGYEQYLFVQELTSQHVLSVSNILSIAGSLTNGTKFFLKEGRLHLFDNDEEKEVILARYRDYLSLKEHMNPMIYVDREFVRAVMITLKQVPMSELILSIKKADIEIVGQKFVQDYLRIIERIINRWKHENNYIRLF